MVSRQNWLGGVWAISRRATAVLSMDSLPGARDQLPADAPCRMVVSGRRLGLVTDDVPGLAGAPCVPPVRSPELLVILQVVLQHLRVEQKRQGLAHRTALLSLAMLAVCCI